MICVRFFIALLTHNSRQVSWYIASELGLSQYEVGFIRSELDGPTLLALAVNTEELHLGEAYFVADTSFSLETQTCCPLSLE